MTLLATVFILVLLVAANAQLQVFRAGLASEPTATLGSTSTICPSDFGDAGFSISCTVPTSIDAAFVYASFFVGGSRQTKEYTSPFFIAGDRNGQGMPNAWTDYPDETTTELSCDLRSVEDFSVKQSYSSTVTFSCDSTTEEDDEPQIPEENPENEEDSNSTDDDGISDDTPDSGDDIDDGGPAYTPPPPNSEPGALYFVPSSGEMVDRMAVRVVRDITFCPDSMFGTSDFSIECISSVNAPTAVFMVNDVSSSPVGRTTSGRFFINGGFSDSPFPWESYPTELFSIACQTNEDDNSELPVRNVRIFCEPEERQEPPIALPSSSPSSSPVPSSVVEEKPEIPTSEECVSLKLSDLQPINGLSRDWYRLPYGILFRPRSSSFSRERVLQRYQFVAPVSGKYGIVLEMEWEYGRHKGFVEAWVVLEKQTLELRKGNSVRTDGDEDLILGYHPTSALRAETIVGSKGYSISTRESLTSGNSYVVSVAGERDGTIINSIILFPCGTDNNCQKDSDVWMKAVDRCSLY